MEIVNKAVDLIAQIISNNKDIDTLICWRASLTNIIYNIFSDHSSLKNIHLIRGENPEVSIALGSVLFAFDPFDVAIRKAKKKTIGIKCIRKLNDIEHDNIISKIINKNDNVYPDMIWKIHITWKAQKLT